VVASAVVAKESAHEKVVRVEAASAALVRDAKASVHAHRGGNSARKERRKENVNVHK